MAHPALLFRAADYRSWQLHHLHPVGTLASGSATYLGQLSRTALYPVDGHLGGIFPRTSPESGPADRIGQAQLDRSGRTVQPTPFALKLTDTVARPLMEIETLRNQRALPLTGRVRLGVTGSILTTLLPKAVADLQRRAPGITL